MATIITSECINCGACEPECPNNAISQGDPIYVIDPLLCTECVGFHDYEACAAVCPVDCCVTDPNNIESEEVLIARARALHNDTDFGENFPSRFRKDQNAAAAPAAAVSQPSVAATEPAAAPKASPAVTPPASAGPASTPKAAPPKAAPPPKAPAKVVPAVAAARPPATKEVKPKKTFRNELPVKFEEMSEQHRTGGGLANGWVRAVIALLQPALGALPHATKKKLEAAVQSPIVFSAAGSTGLNILHNMVLYPVVAMVLAMGLRGPQVIFSQDINIFVLSGIAIAVLEGVWRLRDGIFGAKPAEEMIFRAAFYGPLLGVVVVPLLAKQTGVLREVPVPVDGFYSKGFDEKLERERRYGNVYTLEDRGGALLLRMEFPRWIPDIGVTSRAGIPDEMPDYDYDLTLKDGHFIVKGKCIDEKVRKLSSSVGAFPPEFTTIIPLPENIAGFVHQFDNKLLEVFLVKEDGLGRRGRYS
jgi:hypothetical protein